MSDIRLDEIAPKGKLNAALFVKFLLSDSMDHFKTPTHSKGGDITWRFDEDRGIWTDDGTAWLEKQLSNTMGLKIKRRYFGEVLKLFQVKTYCPPSEFTEDPGSVVLANGELELATCTLASYEATHYHLNTLPIRYDPNAACPNFTKFLTEILPGQETLIQEMVGYCLLKAYPIQKAFVLQGAGANGKSTLLNVIAAFLGTDSVSSESLFSLTTNRFSPAQLYGRLANLAPDIGADELKRTGVLKSLTGGDTLRAERKNQHPFTFRNYAKLIFSCNQLPASPDNSDAFFRRFQIIQFANVFPDKTADKHILDRLTTPEELSGILNWALIGLARLLEQGCLTNTQTTEQIKQLYTEMSDPIQAFLTEAVEEDVDAYVVKDELYRTYAEFCRQRGHIATNPTKFYQALRGRLTVVETQLTINKTRTRIMKGIKTLTPARPARPARGFLIAVNQFQENIRQVETPVQPVQPVQASNINDNSGRGQVAVGGLIHGKSLDVVRRL